MNTVGAEVMKSQGSITSEDIRMALHQATDVGSPSMKHVQERLGISSEHLVVALGEYFSYPVWTEDDLHLMMPDFNHIDYTDSLRHECIVMATEEGRLEVVIANPLNYGIMEWVEEKISQPFTWALAEQSAISAVLSRYEEGVSALDGVVDNGSSGGGARDESEDLSFKVISEDTSPVVRLVHSIIYDALKGGVSDIHLETVKTGMTIRCRIDGVMTTAGNVVGSDLADQVMSRIKIISELDISERRIPQDGRFKVTMRGNDIDFRVSIMPSIYGEDAVLRVLDKDSLSDQMTGLSLDSLGFDARSVDTFRRLTHEPYGMVLVTGPTGSGKTTTLYAAITEINNGQDKIITIEDPVEYHLPGVLQIPVNEKKGLTFARGLRSILRHDPDKIMVGEIRDPETAQIAIQSALTGHLVFTTVHANSVFDVIGRFMHMGVDLYSFVSAINGILAQRLLRVNCENCISDDIPDHKILGISGITKQQAEGFTFRAGRGCSVCRGTGYKGRKAIAEVLHLNDEIREMIIAREPLRLIKEKARASGARFLREAAMDLVMNGETTLQEINRVTFVE